MKKIFTLMAVVALFLSSCSKSNDGQATAVAAISASADGTPLTFNSNTKAMKAQISGLYTLTIIGFQAAGYSDEIAITLTSRSPITTTTYTETDVDGINLSSVNYVKSGAPYISYFSQANPSRVSITAISATSVQGTFSGDVFQLDGSGNIVSKRAISNGRFNLKF